ncbi:F0F1 ATP synthase subunit delta [Vibrio casei]|uniref:ATP synthase subunit delta n=1 Tax=Vibrio casei TaxID=673372 RepID=A0A368LK14_9VIBR|nr:F0F1 ATP synthase subunit delta [Vibrio casei]RCS72197.1 F0F1 ATP synthase subunit delta [Vibrio casei]SJN21770.1 ATP synthase delta chain [Vibrio casei]
MSDLTTIARPYAKAAFEFSVEKDAVDQWSEMLSFAAEVTKNEDVVGLLNKALVAEQLAEIFISICAEFDEHGQNFIKVLAQNGRLKALPEICEEFLILKKELDNQVDVEITSATTLTETQLAELSSKLEQRLDRKVKLNCSVDETLLSGVIIRTGDLIIDNSTRGRLNRLSDALMS